MCVCVCDKPKLCRRKFKRFASFDTRKNFSKLLFIRLFTCFSSSFYFFIVFFDWWWWRCAVVCPPLELTLIHLCGARELGARAYECVTCFLVSCFVRCAQIGFFFFLLLFYYYYEFLSIAKHLEVFCKIVKIKHANEWNMNLSYKAAQTMSTATATKTAIQRVQCAMRSFKPASTRSPNLARCRACVRHAMHVDCTLCLHIWIYVKYTT